jgi:membrane protease YdiL (CAAX protease family)
MATITGLTRGADQPAPASRRHELIAYFALAYAICAGAILIYTATPTLPHAVFFFTAVFSPTIAAVLVTAVTRGRPGITSLLSGLLRWRIGWRWYLAASVFFLGALALSLAYVLLGNGVAGPKPGLTIGFLVTQLGFTLVSGPLSEEVGWRGFALPRMESRWTALTASVVLGLLWAGWHLPQYLLPNNTMLPVPILFPQCVGLAIVFTWIYNNTGGSLLATVLTHFGFNFAGAFLAGHLGLLPPMLLYIGGSLMSLMLVVAVVVYAGPRLLSRHPAADMPFVPPDHRLSSAARAPHDRGNASRPANAVAPADPGAGG